jgi:hypothetical protein
MKRPASWRQTRLFLAPVVKGDHAALEHGIHDLPVQMVTHHLDVANRPEHSAEPQQLIAQMLSL